MKGSVRKRGEKWSYYFTYKQDGKHKKKEKGGFATKREAEAALREALHLYDKNNIVKQFNSYTLYDYIIYWLDNEGVKTLKPRSLELYTQVTNRYIKNEIGHIKLTEFNHVILYKYLSEKQIHYSASTISNIRNVLGNSFNLAVRSGILPFNPLVGVKLNTKAYNTTREQDAKALTVEEIKTLLEATKNSRYYLPIILALQMGLRRGEILGLTWDNINFDEKTMTIDKILLTTNGKTELTSPKTKGSVRTIKMTSEVYELLQQRYEHQKQQKQIYGEYYYQANDFVYCQKNGSPIKSTSGFTTAFHQYIKRNLPFPIRFHDLRHTHATLLLEAGVTPKMIQERLGHTDIKTTLNVYSHVTKNLENIELNKFEEIIK